ncbi:MAG: alpha-tubulin suppressor-like RCC1 family protein [Polyangiales bacterium]|jgi:alpha-tubulin suppressor-like RCC1 family protein
MRIALLVVSLALFTTSPLAAQGPVDITLGHGFGCGLNADGTVRCWGASRSGQCGVEERGVAATPIAGLSGVEEIDAGHSHACARSGGDVQCWGHNQYGQLGPAGAGMEQSTSPLAVSGLPPIVELGVGNFSTCARAENGSVWCWGYGDSGQLGPRVERSATPVQIPRVRNATKLFAGHNHFCTLDVRNRLTCWGSNSYGQAGSRRGERSPPHVVRGTGSIQSVALGANFSCLLNTDGGIRCWGEAYGYSDSERPGPPHQLVRHPRIANVTHLALAGENMCIIVGGVPKCLGVNRRGELHVPSPEDGNVVIVPTSVPGASNVTRIEMHDRIQCIAGDAGPWRCWGWNRGRENGAGVGSGERDVTTPTPLRW